MDELDLSLLTIIQKNSRASLKDISSQINLSLPATRERIRKLEQQNYIKGYSAVVNLGKLGRPLICFCMVILRTQATPCDTLFCNYIKDHPDVLECFCIAGDREYILKIATESTITLEKFLVSLRNEYGVLKTYTYPAISTIKEYPSVAT